MDLDRFNMLARFFTDARSRRVALSALLGSPLAVLTMREAEARKGKRKKRKKNKKKQRPPTCTDGKKNGDETDVDCGGTCPRCESGETCAAPTDCETSYCADGACQTCQGFEACGSDSSGTCSCYPEVGPPPGLPWIGLTCIRGNSITSQPPTPECPSGQIFIATSSGTYACAKPCGAPA